MKDLAQRPTPRPVPLIVVSMAMALAACTHSTHHVAVIVSARPSSPGPAPVPSAPPLTGQQATALAQQLTAGTEAGLRSALAIPPGQSIDPAAAAQLGAIGPITFDLSTFHYIDQNNATVVGTVAHPPAGTSPTWTFTLTYVSSVWKLVDGQPGQ